jgi:hypothetical protein
MNIFEHFRDVDELVAKTYQEKLLLLQQLQAEGLNALGLSFSSNQPLSRLHRDGFGNLIDADHDGIPDTMDNFFGDGPSAPWNQ